MKKPFVRAFSLFLALLLSGVFLPMVEAQAAETNKKAIIAKWQEEKKPFTLRQKLNEQKEKKKICTSTIPPLRLLQSNTFNTQSPRIRRHFFTKCLPFSFYNQIDKFKLKVS